VRECNNSFKTSQDHLSKLKIKGIVHNEQCNERTEEAKSIHGIDISNVICIKQSRDKRRTQK